MTEQSHDMPPDPRADAEVIPLRRDQVEPTTAPGAEVEPATDRRPVVIEPDEILPAPARGRVRDVVPILRDRQARGQAGRAVASMAGRAPVAYAGAVARGSAVVGRHWWRWVSARDVRDSAHKAGRLHDKYREVRSLAQSRLMWTGGALAGGAAAVGVGDLAYGTPAVWAAGGLLSAVLALAGRRPAGTRPGRVPLRPAVTLTASVPLRYLEDVVRSALVAIAPRSAGDVRVYGARQHPWGWTLTVYTAGLSLAEDRIVAALERHLQVPAGSITPVADRTNAALTVLRILSGDPLAGVGSPAHHAPGSLTITAPLPVGMVMDGRELVLSLLRVHVGLIGGTGSGKSSTLWTLLDVLTACRDVVVWGIDLTGGPACHAWGDCVQEYATTPDDARALLERALTEARRRAAVLGERSRPSLDRPDDEPPGDENWTPTRDDPALVVVVDEFPALAEAGLMPLVRAVLREGRKASVQIILASQRAGRDDLGSTTVREMLGVRVMLPCAAGDVDMLLPGGRAEGWRPDRLIPSDGVEPNDAGRFYIRAGGHADPMICAGYRLTLPEIHRRAIERMRAGLPTLTGEAGTDAAGLVPPLLATIADLLADEPDDALVPTADLLDMLADPPTAAALGVAMGRWGCGPARTATTRGYRPGAVRAAVARIQSGGPVEITETT